MATRARRRVGLLALPDEVLGVVLAYGDLRARFTCVAASSPLRDAHERLSPAHEHKLLARAFPMLKPLLDANKTLAPGDVYKSQRQLFHEDSPPEEAPTVTPGAYTFYLEVELHQLPFHSESLYVGTGTLGVFDPSDWGATVSFPIPADIWSQARGHLDTSQQYGLARVNIRVMASRARGGLVECAQLFTGDITRDDHLTFESDSQAIQISPTARRLLETTARFTVGEGDMEACAIWFGPASPDIVLAEVLTLCLQWSGEIGDMRVDEAKRMFEFLDWAPACRVI